MKRECSYVELFYLVQEWQDLLGSRISKIVVCDDLIVFELYKSGGKKTQLNVILPVAWVGDYDYSAPLSPPSFAVQLRNLFEGVKIDNISLVEGERIIVIDCKDYVLCLQLFGKGNLFVLKDGVVHAAFRQGSIFGVDVRVNHSFTFEKKIDPRKQKIVRSDEPLINMLTKIGLGKLYAQEVLLHAGDKKIAKVRDEVKSLFSQKVHACVVLDNGRVVDITPFSLKYYSQYTCDSFSFFNEAINSVMQKRVQLLAQERVSQSFDARVQRVKSAIAAQELHLEVQKVEAQKNQEFGELIYENYNAVKEVLEVLQQARKKYSWDDIKSRLKNHPVIKEVDENKGKIVVELKH